MNNIKAWEVVDGSKTYFIKEWYIHDKVFYKSGSYYTSDGSGHQEDWYPTYRMARRNLLTDKRMKLITELAPKS